MCVQGDCQGVGTGQRVGGGAEEQGEGQGEGVGATIECLLLASRVGHLLLRCALALVRRSSRIYTV